MTSPSATRLGAVSFPGPAGAIEGLLQRRDGVRHAVAALVCHPHPVYGGTMHNKVVHRVAATLFQMGAAVLRFNFRGAGKSEGVHDHGIGELEDARAALGFLRGQFPDARAWAAGFSFGAWIAARLAASEPAIERLILIAPPLATSSFEVLGTAAVPKLVLQGTADTVCAIDVLEREFPSWAEPKELIRVPGATHFFDKQLGALASALSHALAGQVEGTAR